jgi:cellulose synthase operon protein YhjQ
MDSRETNKISDKIEDHGVTETPEDVAVLYSWANLHGAKYRDFSASRREYRAQLRHRAAEQVREQALLAQAEAEDAAATADAAARNASKVALNPYSEDSDSHRRSALREAEEAARTAAAERLEAARRAEVAAVAEAVARREEREIAEAHASAQRQAARYADSEIRRRATDAPELPGRISDPYNPQSQPQASPLANSAKPQTKTEIRPSAASTQEPPSGSDPIHPEPRTFVKQNMTPRRPQGYRPDEASGVRQIYRGPDDSQAEYTTFDPDRHSIPMQNRAVPAAPLSQDMKPIPEQPVPSPLSPSSEGSMPPLMGQRRTDSPSRADSRSSPADPASVPAANIVEPWSPPAKDRSRPTADAPADSTRESSPSLSSTIPTPPRLSGAFRSAPPISSTPPRPVSPFSQALVPSDSTRGRRAQDDFDYQHPNNSSDLARRNPADSSSESTPLASARPAFQADPAGPAWLYAAPANPAAPKPLPPPPAPSQSSVADTLQHSRERVAARWYALKGVFEQPGLDHPEVAPVRQKETRTPVLAVFSLAGGVGKTSLVATVGRALSSMGEKVLLTDTTSHGLLPFYFGASELRHGTVRTFSPPSGSTDAPIYLVSYDVDHKTTEDEAQEHLAEEIINNGRGAHRILLDLTVGSSWIVRRMSRMSPTILVPVAPDMNSVISLQTVEKFFSGVNDGDGRPLQPYYVLNQFDTSLPLHLDVREVMRRQLGDRLLPFVIRRAQSVSEALAEGMTVVDYAPDAPVAEDYLNLATWLRTVAAPATAGFRNVRWSER